MICAKLTGGIGNICFIASTAYALALDHKDRVVFDVSGIPLNNRDRDHEGWFKTIFRKIDERTIETDITYSEPSFSFSPIPYQQNMKIFGYFQSPFYFDHRKKKIVDLLTDYKKEIYASLGTYLASFSRNMISLHVRRTDYIDSQHTHIVLPENYYGNAIKQMKRFLGRSYKNYLFLIFSDDIDWCKKQPVFRNIRCHFVEETDPPAGTPVDVFQLYLMTMCKHHIIANSSYSWWGAYLNESPGKIVIAPSKWFNSGNSGGKGPNDWSTIYCNNWVLCT